MHLWKKTLKKCMMRLSEQLTEKNRCCTKIFHGGKNIKANALPRLSA